MAGNVFILPAVLVVLFLAIFPLIVSLYMSLTRFKFVKGGFEFKWVGLANYEKLLLGSEQTHFLGKLSEPLAPRLGHLGAGSRVCWSTGWCVISAAGRSRLVG